MDKAQSERVDQVLRRLLKTPPKPHAPLKAKRKTSRTVSKAGKTTKSQNK